MTHRGPVDAAAVWDGLVAIRRRVRSGHPLPFDVPLAAGAAVARVSEGGVVAIDGAPDAAAQTLVELHGPLATATPGRPHVVAHLGQSLDGRIATAGGASHYVNGSASLDHLHRLRALADAVVVGAATVALDDPRLTTRRVAGDNPVRVVLDRGCGLPATRRVFSDGLAPTLRVCAAERCRGADGPSAEVLGMAGWTDGVPAGAVLAALAARGLHCVLVEGGGVTVSQFLRQGALHRLQLALAPMLIGSGRPAITLPEISDLADALRPQCRTYPLGSDVLFDCRFAAGTG